MASTDLKGQVALIIDSGSNIGAECATLLLLRGAEVVEIDGREHLTGGENDQSVSTNDIPAITQATSKFSRIDCVLFITHLPCGQDEFGETAWSNMRRKHLDGAFQVASAVWPIFRRQRGGRLLFVSTANTTTAASATSLFGLFGFSQTLAREGAKYGITVNVVMRQMPLFSTGVLDVSPFDEAAIGLDPSLIVELLHSSNSPPSGALLQVGARDINQLTWERSLGVLLNPEKGFTAGALERKWNEVTSFASKTFPDAAADFQALLAKALDLPGNAKSVEQRFDGKVAIVTGAASGLGRCYAVAFAQLGASVLVNDLSDPTPTVREIVSQGGNAKGCRRSCEDCEAVVADALAHFGRVDILINNAGFLRDKAFVNMDQRTWKTVLDVHLASAGMTRALWPLFVKQRSGVIVNTSSTSGIYGVFGQANYSTAKLALFGLTEATARQGAECGIRVNAIAPVASTAGLAAAWQNTNDKNKSVAMRPEYIVPAVLILCSDYVDGRRNTTTGGLFEIGCGWHAATRLRPKTSETVRQHSKLVTENAKASMRFRKDKKILSNEYSYTPRDVLLYNISVGATRSELQFVYENSPDFQALPTFGIIPFFNREVISHHAEVLPNFDPNRAVLGEHVLEIFHYPLPTTGQLKSTGKVVEIVDKGSAALVRTIYTTWDVDTGRKLFANEVSFFAGGCGGFDDSKMSTHSRKPLEKKTKPSCAADWTRAADWMMLHKTSPEQAVLYRLNADREAIHIDPKASQQHGFQAPILHGHCTMSIAAKYIFQRYGRIRRLGARFVGVVIPGMTLKIQIWRESKRVMYNVSDVETNKLCIDQGSVVLFEDNGLDCHI